MTSLRATAILNRDIGGSTARFRALSEPDLTALLAAHRALITRVAATQDGRIVKPEGDGFWIAFPSVTAATLAAMARQEERRDLVGTVWDARVQRIDVASSVPWLEDVEIYRLEPAMRS